MHSTPLSSDQECYDTELHCHTCGTRLYLSAADAAMVLRALQQTGRAGLRCVCGEIVLIGPDLLPIWPPPSTTNDEKQGIGGRGQTDDSLQKKGI